MSERAAITLCPSRATARARIPRGSTATLPRTSGPARPQCTVLDASRGDHLVTTSYAEARARQATCTRPGLVMRRSISEAFQASPRSNPPLSSREPRTRRSRALGARVWIKMLAGTQGQPSKNERSMEQQVHDSSGGYNVWPRVHASAEPRYRVPTVRRWARAPPPGGAVLDLGRGDGVPISQAPSRRDSWPMAWMPLPRCWRHSTNDSRGSRGARPWKTGPLRPQVRRRGRLGPALSARR